MQTRGRSSGGDGRAGRGAGRKARGGGSGGLNGGRARAVPARGGRASRSRKRRFAEIRGSRRRSVLRPRLAGGGGHDRAVDLAAGSRFLRRKRHIAETAGVANPARTGPDEFGARQESDGHSPRRLPRLGAIAAAPWALGQGSRRPTRALRSGICRPPVPPPRVADLSGSRWRGRRGTAREIAVGDASPGGWRPIPAGARRGIRARTVHLAEGRERRAADETPRRRRPVRRREHRGRAAPAALARVSFLDLVADRLLALVLVGVARGAPQSEEKKGRRIQPKAGPSARLRSS